MHINLSLNDVKRCARAIGMSDHGLTTFLQHSYMFKTFNSTFNLTRQMLRHRGASLMMHALPYTMDS